MAVTITIDKRLDVFFYKIAIWNILYKFLNPAIIELYSQRRGLLGTIVLS